MAATEIYTNNATTTVTSGGATAGTSGTVESWGVTSSATFPGAATGSTQFHVGDPAQPTELIAVTNVAGTAWTVTRGAESTSPVAHAQGFTVASVITAGGLNGLLSGASGPLAVTSGGTGGTAVTSYAVVTGGTSSSTALQTVSGVGSSGQVLTSQGAGSLPSFQTVSTPSWQPTDTGLSFLAWTYPIQQCSVAGQVGNNTVTLMRVNVRQQISVTSVSIAISGAVGGGLTTGENFLGLYAGQTVGSFTAGTRVAVSSDLTTNFATAGILTASLVSGPFTLPAGFYWVAFLGNGGTMPSLARAPAITNAITNMGMTAANSIAATAGNGTALSASFTPSSLSQINGYYWAALS